MKHKMLDCLAFLEARAIHAGIADEILRIWRRGNLTNEDLLNMIEEHADKVERRNA